MPLFCYLKPSRKSEEKHRMQGCGIFTIGIKCDKVGLVLKQDITFIEISVGENLIMKGSPYSDSSAWLYRAISQKIMRYAQV